MAVVAARAGQDWITSAFLEVVWSKYRPVVTILSYGEPDVTSHFHSTGAEATRDIIAHCDRQFGRVLDWWEVEGRADGVQIIAVSDHGHITGHTRVVGDRQPAGCRLPARHRASAGRRCRGSSGQAGALYLAELSDEQIARLVATIPEHPWCGPVFTRARNEIDGIAPGSLGKHLVLADHARAPDVSFSFRADDGVDPFGRIGGTFYDNDRRTGLGVHGGPHPEELAAVGIVAGSAFPATSSISTVPSGICDRAEIIGFSQLCWLRGRATNDSCDWSNDPSQGLAGVLPLEPERTAE